LVEYDVAIAGDGIAGLTAALFSARYGCSTVVFGSLAGGELLSLEAIEDFPGFATPVLGYELCPTLHAQAADAGAEFCMAEVTGVEPNGSEFVIRSGERDVRAGTLIVATGAAFRPLGVPGEQAFEGRGVSHCASCDGPIFSGKTVGVAGLGDHALQEAVTLTHHANRVVIFCPEPELAAQEIYKQRVLSDPSVTIHYRTEVTEILGRDVITGVRVRNTMTAEQFDVDLSALFVYAGLIPRTGFLNGLVGLDDGGCVATDQCLRTDVPGIFAAGIVRADAAGHAITSAGDGATAAISAYRFLRKVEGAVEGDKSSKAVA
jgi:thioredoxin reductase (NADPH)